MDPRDPSQRPSIFSRPEPDEEPHTPARPEPKAFVQSAPPVADPPAQEPPDDDGPSRALVIAVGAGGLVLLLIVGFVASLTLGARDGAIGATSPSATASASAATYVTPTPIASATATASPVPTPAPTPAGPPQEIAVGAWATVAVDELNVRSAAGTDATSNYTLVRGAVVHVAEGPEVVADLNWYRIASLGGAVGWVTSGWVAEPFVTTVVDDPILIRCGEVKDPVFDVVNGVPTPRDPLGIGPMALPAAAFSDLSLGVIELLRGVGGEACFSAQVGADGRPEIDVQLTATACGHAVQDGDFFRLRPAAGQTVGVEAQVKNPAIVHPALLLGGPPADRQSSNLRSVLTVMASSDGATGCIHLGVTENADGVVAYRSADTTQCSVVHEYNADSIKLSPATGGETVWIKLTSRGSEPGIFPLGDPVPVAISVTTHDEGRNAYAYPGYDPECG